MKYLVSILLFLAGFIAKSQQRFPTGAPTQFSTGFFKQGYHQSDSGTIIANRDTNWLAKYSGTLVFRPANKKFYYFDSTNLTWNLFGTVIDTTSLSNRINLKLNISDTTGKWLAQSTRLVDTMYRVNDSTVGYTIKGTAYTFQIKGGASGGGGGSGTVTSVGLSMPSAFTVTGSPVTGASTLSVSGAGTTAQYIRGNGTLATTDSGMIPNFYLKVRGLLSGTSPITYNSTTGAFGINNANTSGTKGAASFNSASFSDNGSGLISLTTPVTSGSCTNCNVTWGADGRATAYANGTGGSGSGVDTIYRTLGKDSIFFTINGNTHAIKDSTGAGGGGTVTSVSGTTNRITVTNPTTTPVIDIAATYVGQTSITTLGTIATGTWNGTTIGATFGGTGQTAVTTGDLLYGSAANTWSKLAGVATGNALISGGVTTAPSWGKIGLTTHVSGILPVANGGTGTATPSLVAGTSISITGSWPNQTINASGGGSQGLQDVITLNPLLTKNDTIDQRANRLYFTNGPFETDSVRYTPTESFMSTDSILGIGHSIANLLGASTSDSNFIGKAHTYYNKPWANWAEVGAGITRVVWQHNSHTGPAAHRSTIAMGALNTIRAGWNNLKTYRKIVNAYKAIFCNQFAIVQDSASGANATRSGAGWTTYAGQADAAKFNTTSFTNAINDSISYAFTGTGVGVVMMGTDSSAAQYIGSIVNIKIDGVSQGTFTTNNQTDGIADFISGFPGHRSPMAFIFYNLKDTIHNITIVNTEAHYMYVDYFCKFVNPTDASPYVIMHEPYLGAAGYAGVGSNALINAFNHGEDSMALTLPHNFPVYVGRTNTVYNAGATTADIAGDDIHPNNLGHREIFLYGLLLAIEHMSEGKVFYTQNSLFLNDGIQNRKIWDTLNLIDATLTQRGLIGTTAQVMGDGIKTFTKDIIVNGASVGIGGGGFISNTRIGAGAGNNWSGDLGNTAVGQDALALNGSGGFFNTAVGRRALGNVFSGFENAAFGHAAGYLNTGNLNVFLGYSAGGLHTTGSNKLYIANIETSTLIYGDFSNNRVIINGGSSASPSDNGVGALQVNGKETISTIDSITSAPNMLTQDPNTGEIKKAAVPGGSATTLYSGDGTLAGNRTVTGSNNSLTFNGIFNYRINANSFVLDKTSATAPYSLTVTGSDNVLRFGYTPTPATYSKGSGITIDTNNNVSLGTAQIPTTAPLYTAGSAFTDGLQNQAGNFFLVTSVTGNITAAITQNFFVIDATGGNITITLPAASTAFGANMGIDYVFKRIDNSGNTITIARAGSDTIDSATSFTLATQWESKKLRALSTSTWGIY